MPTNYNIINYVDNLQLDYKRYRVSTYLLDNLENIISDSKFIDFDHKGTILEYDFDIDISNSFIKNISLKNEKDIAGITNSWSKYAFSFNNDLFNNWDTNKYIFTNLNKSSQIWKNELPDMVGNNLVSVLFNNNLQLNNEFAQYYDNMEIKTFDTSGFLHKLPKDLDFTLQFLNKFNFIRETPSTLDNQKVYYKGGNPNNYDLNSISSRIFKFNSGDYINDNHYNEDSYNTHINKDDIIRIDICGSDTIFKTIPSAVDFKTNYGSFRDSQANSSIYSQIDIKLGDYLDDAKVDTFIDTIPNDININRKVNANGTFDYYGNFDALFTNNGPYDTEYIEALFTRIRLVGEYHDSDNSIIVKIKRNGNLILQANHIKTEPINFYKPPYENKLSNIIDNIETLLNRSDVSNNSEMQIFGVIDKSDTQDIVSIYSKYENTNLSYAYLHYNGIENLIYKPNDILDGNNIIFVEYTNNYQLFDQTIIDWLTHSNTHFDISNNMIYFKEQKLIITYKDIDNLKDSIIDDINDANNGDDKFITWNNKVHKFKIFIDSSLPNDDTIQSWNDNTLRMV